MSLLERPELRSASAELLQWTVTSSERETIVALVGEIDLACDERLRQVLTDVVAGHPARIVVDLTDVAFLDSTGIRQLVIAANAASEFGCRLVVRHPTATIERTLEICGLRDLLHDDSPGTRP
jgi:anti-sigma B factor antagonist